MKTTGYKSSGLDSQIDMIWLSVSGNVVVIARFAEVRCALKITKKLLTFQIGLFGAGSEPKIVSTLSQNGNAPFPSHLSKIGSKESYQNMMTLHKTRKIADKVSFRKLSLSNFSKRVTNWRKI